MNCVKVGSVYSNSGGKRFKELFEGTTYMNLRVLLCAAGGSFDVMVESDYECSEKEFKEFLLFVIAGELIK